MNAPLPEETGVCPVCQCPDKDHYDWCTPGARAQPSSKELATLLREAHNYIYTMEWKSDGDHAKAQRICAALSRAIWQQPDEPTEPTEHHMRKALQKILERSNDPVAHSIAGEALVGGLSEPPVASRDAADAEAWRKFCSLYELTTGIDAGAAVRHVRAKLAATKSDNGQCPVCGWPVGHCNAGCTAAETNESLPESLRDPFKVIERGQGLLEDAYRYRWLKSHFRFFNDSNCEIWFDATLQDDGVSDLSKAIDRSRGAVSEGESR